MNFSQRLGLLILIIISVAYVYFSFFNKEFNFPTPTTKPQEVETFSPYAENNEKNFSEDEKSVQKDKIVKIFILDKSGELRSVNRDCKAETQKSCFAYAIKELISGPTRWEKSKGFTSEIPQGTKILSIRESNNSIQIDLSSDFEAGGGAESTYMRVKQIIKTANANTSIPTYLYINGRQANVIGGEGIMIKQPLSERSFDE